MASELLTEVYGARKGQHLYNSHKKEAMLGLWEKSLDCGIFRDVVTLDTT